MIQLIKPEFKELSFRQKLIGDAETMAYNKKWGGAIAFPPEKWSQWYECWVGAPDRRFYRYIYSRKYAAFVGEVAFRFDEALQCYICDVLVQHCYRGQGFGRAGLMLLLDEARRQGISVIYDNIAPDNPASGSSGAAASSKHGETTISSCWKSVCKVPLRADGRKGPSLTADGRTEPAKRGRLSEKKAAPFCSLWKKPQAAYNRCVFGHLRSHGAGGALRF